METIASRIHQKLTEGLSPVSLAVRDDSARHAGHAGARPEGETHFHIEIVASAFGGLNRIDRQRLVYQLLSEEMAGRVHALGMVTLTPEEATLQGRSLP